VGIHGPRADQGDRLRWKCSDLDCSHTVGCVEKVMYSDDGDVQIHGEISWNEDDRKWDWCVRVDHYGSSDMTQLQVEAMAARHARRMAAQVGMLFRGPKVVAIVDVQD
jgi:hypothetical protein